MSAPNGPRPNVSPDRVRQRPPPVARTLAELQIRVAFVNRFPALGTAKIARVSR